MLEKVFGPKQFMGTATFYARINDGQNYSMGLPRNNLIRHLDEDTQNKVYPKNTDMHLDEKNENLAALCISLDPRTLFLKHPYLTQEEIQNSLITSEELETHKIDTGIMMYRLPDDKYLSFKNMPGLLDYLSLIPDNEQVFYCGERRKHIDVIDQLRYDSLKFLKKLDPETVFSINPAKLWPTIMDYQKRDITPILLRTYINPLIRARKDQETQKYDALKEALIMLAIPNPKIIAEIDKILQLIEKSGDKERDRLIELTAKKINAIQMEKRKAAKKLGVKIKRITRKKSIILS